MKVLVNENWVDLESPIYMSEAQRERFIAFFKENFKDVEVANVEEATKEFGSREVVMKEWTEQDLLELLGSKDNEVLSREMDRTIMSVKMKRGSFVPNFWMWVKETNREPVVNIEAVRAYLKGA